MPRFSFLLILLSICFFSCKTSNSPQSNATEEKSTLSQSSPENDAASSLSKEDQHQFNAFLKQGDSNYATGNFREALNFYKKAQALAPEQLGNEKLVACIKAMQEPSTRRKSKTN